MMLPRRLIVTAGLVGLAAGVAGSLTVPAPERGVLRGARATVHGSWSGWKVSCRPRGRGTIVSGAHLSALIRARRDRSVAGAIRTAEAFRELEDRAVSDQCLHIAAQLAAGDEGAQ